MLQGIWTTLQISDPAGILKENLDLKRKVEGRKRGNGREGGEEEGRK